VCLPETFTGLGLGIKDWIASAETVPGPTTEALAKIAAKYRSYVICPMLERHGDKTYSSVILLDRAGGIVGTYRKMYPPIGEMDAGITPGSEPVVLETEFGPVGFVIGFDLYFREVMEGLKSKGAKLVFFPSMYPGGLQLSIWAHELSFFMASAFIGNGSSIVDPLRRKLVVSNSYMPIISRVINLDYEVLHCDNNSRKWETIKRKYGSGVDLDITEPEDIFVLYSNLKDITAQGIIQEFELEARDGYFERTKAIRQNVLQ
jgi:hypothetical protein